MKKTKEILIICIILMLIITMLLVVFSSINNKQIITANNSYYYSNDDSGTTIIGVQEGNTYKIGELDRIVVIDPHLESVTLLFNRTTPHIFNGLSRYAGEPFVISSQLFNEKGDYKLTVVDSYGNTTVVNFKMDSQSNQLTPKAGTTFNVNEKDRLITNILPKTKISELANNLDGTMDYTIQSSDGKVVTNPSLYLGTNYKIVMNDGTYYTLVVLGDVNSDGQITVIDLARLNKYTSGLIDINKLEKVAANLNFDDYIDIIDLARLNKYIAGLMDITV